MENIQSSFKKDFSAFIPKDFGQSETSFAEIIGAILPLQFEILHAKKLDIELANSPSDLKTNDLFRIAFEIENSRLDLYLEAQLLHKIINTKSQNLDLNNLPPQFYGLILEHLFCDSIEKIANEIESNIQIIDITKSHESRELIIANGTILSILDWDQDTHFAALVNAIDGQIINKIKQNNAFGIYDNAVCEAQILLGEAIVNAAQFENLENGDVIFPAQPINRNLKILIGANTYFNGIAHTKNDGQTQIEIISEAINIGENNQNSEIDNSIDIPVEFSIGRQNLKIKELPDFVPGHIFELSNPLNKFVEILSGDKIIANGELMTINGNTGIRIIRKF